MNKRFLIFLVFAVLTKNVYSLKTKSFIEMKKDIFDTRESSINIQIFDIKHSFLNNYFKMRANLFQKAAYSNGMFLRLGVPFRIGTENIYAGLKGAYDDYIFTISSLGIEGNFRIYIKTLFKNEEKNIKYGFQSFMAHSNDDEINFAFIQPYFKYLYKFKKFKFNAKFKGGVKEYYKAESPVSLLKEIYYSPTIKTEEKFQKLQVCLENIFKIKNKKFGENFIKFLLKQKYKLKKELILGVKEKFKYSMISINSISNISFDLSPFMQLRYELFDNLFLTHKLQFILNQGFNVLNNSIYILFETKLNYGL